MQNQSKFNSPKDYIESLKEPRKSQIQEIFDFIHKTVPELKPYIQGDMIGFGKYHYKYPSGREGDWFTIGLASNKNYISIYVVATDGKEYLAEKYAKQLPHANIGKSCIRYKKFEDIEWKALKKLFIEAVKLGPPYKMNPQ